ncbi:MAG: hypothetical protein FJY85_20210 [Deltaproteobacteria bacterium]|nr:hypothetical protein [Deltaproteobacteria bacterium]
MTDLLPDVHEGTVMTKQEKLEFLMNVKLRVSRGGASEELMEIKRASFDAKNLDKHWEYKDGNITVRSKCWLLRWCLDTRDTDIMRNCQRVWNAIFDKDFESVATTVGRDFIEECVRRKWAIL